MKKLIIVLLLFTSILARGQTIDGRSYNPVVIPMKWKYGYFENGLMLPTDTIASTYPGVAVKGGKFYFNPGGTFWQQVQAGSSIDSAVYATILRVRKITDSITAVLEAQISTKQPAGSYALSTHLHAQGDVVGLSTALSGKVSVSDTSAMLQPYYKASNPDGFVPGSRTITINSVTYDLSANRSWNISTGIGSVSWGSIGGTLDDQADLQSALAGKQAAGSYSLTGHGHVIGDITNLQSTLNGKLAISDSATMLQPYLRSAAAAATYQPLGSYATTTQLAAKADTGRALPRGGTQGQMLLKSAAGDFLTEWGDYVNADGKSAYEIAVENGFSGNVTAWLASLVGATGPSGATGSQGPAGATGSQGPAGVGVPVGGTNGQILKKINGTDYNTEWGSVSQSDIANLQDSLNAVRNSSAVAGYTIPYTTSITSGSSSEVPASTYRIHFDPASVIASYTLTLPPSPADGQRLMIKAGRQIAAGSNVVTTFTVSPNAGQTLFAAITPNRLVSGDIMEFEYQSSSTTWFRIK